MSKIEIISDRIEMEQSRIVVEMGVPLEFLREAVKSPETIKTAFAVAFATAMDDFLVKRNMVK